MAIVPVMINGKAYRVACDDGQEEHLARLGQYVDQRCTQLIDAAGHVSESLMLVMASLLIADELSDVTGELQELRNALGATGATDGPSAREMAEERVALAIESIAKRVEGIAETLETP
ncbi:cell division protein ZapA [Rhodospirillum sp. A1_3_36]|uniref:cell division protein ZapA n=1 Tax=Rhodospirillum sp. A1_3_36 TaxID=3391666 RepID=UPI0039A650F4